MGGWRAFNTFKLERAVRSDANADLLSYAEKFKPESENVYLHGPVGTGKTHIAVAMARVTSERQMLVMKPQEVSRFIRASESAAQEEDRIEDLVTAKVLVLDDLGTEKLTDFLASLLYEIIDGRYMRGTGGLIVTSNLSLGDMAKNFGDERITSRLVEMCRGRIFSLKDEQDHRLEWVGKGQ